MSYDPVLDAAARASFDHGNTLAEETWEGITEDDRESHRALARAVLAAASPLIRRRERSAVRAWLLGYADNLDPAGLAEDVFAAQIDVLCSAADRIIQTGSHLRTLDSHPTGKDTP